jgi:hypothetical protein
MSLVFDHLGLHRRQLGDLMTCRLRVFAQQQRPTLSTAFWFDRNDSVDLLWWFEPTPVPPMSFLPTTLAPRRRSLWPWGRIRRIRRRGPRGVTRGLAQPFAQVSHFGLQGLNLRLQSLHLLPQRHNQDLDSRWSAVPVFFRNRQFGG